MSFRALMLSQRRVSRQENPFRFQTAKGSPKFLLIIFLLFVIVVVSLIYWLFFTRAFAINTVEIKGTIGLPQEKVSTMVNSQLSKHRWGIVRQDNLFAFNASDLSSAINNEFAVQKVSIQKQRPNTLVITIFEKPREAVWVSKNANYALDVQGVALGLTQSTGSEVMIYDQSGADVSAGDQVLSVAALAFINQLFKNEKLRQFNPKFVIVEKRNPDYVIVKTGEGWSSYFSISAGIDEQVENLELILKHSMPIDQRKNLDYVDLRFGEKVYYK